MRNFVRALIAALSLVALPMASQAGVFVSVSVGIPPPVLPVYVQPPCPSPGYIWIPGYWAWDDGYYWVPGTWALAPAVGLLWTPGYWGWGDGAYLWHEGYWGPHVGFYGGINYGFGYGGVGYEGGYWRGHDFFYNRAVTNISTNITNVYSRTVVNNVTVSHVSFNGGAGGVRAHPTAAEITAGRESHRGPTHMQLQHVQVARTNTSLRASQNGGRPAIAATQRPGVFSGHGVVAATNHAQSTSRTASGRIDRPPVTAAHTDRASHAGAAGPGHESAPRLAAARPPAPREESAQPHATYSQEHRASQAPVAQAPAAHAPMPAPQAYHPAAYPQPSHATQPPHAAYESAAHASPQPRVAPAPTRAPEHVPTYAPRPAPQPQPRPAPQQGTAHERGPSERPEHAERGF